MEMGVYGIKVRVYIRSEGIPIDALRCSKIPHGCFPAICIGGDSSESEVFRRRWYTMFVVCSGFLFIMTYMTASKCRLFRRHVYTASVPPSTFGFVRECFHRISVHLLMLPPTAIQTRGPISGSQNQKQRQPTNCWSLRQRTGCTSTKEKSFVSV